MFLFLQTLRLHGTPLSPPSVRLLEYIPRCFPSPCPSCLTVSLSGVSHSLPVCLGCGRSRLKDIQQTPVPAAGGRLDEDSPESQPRSAPSSPGSARPRRGISRGSSAVTYRRQPTEPLARLGGRAAASVQSTQ